MSKNKVDHLEVYVNPSKTFKSLNKIDVFKEIIDEVVLKTSFYIDGEEVLTEVKKREALSTTGFENGFAIPHGKSAHVHSPLIVLMKTEQKIEWDSLDGLPVSIIFMLIVPKENGNDIHLKLLSKLSYHLMDKAIQEAFKKADTQTELKEIIQKIII